LASFATWLEENLPLLSDFCCIRICFLLISSLALNCVADGSRELPSGSLLARTYREHLERVKLGGFSRGSQGAPSWFVVSSSLSIWLSRGQALVRRASVDARR
jgi:hypothetical protein